MDTVIAWFHVHDCLQLASLGSARSRDGRKEYGAGASDALLLDQ